MNSWLLLLTTVVIFLLLLSQVNLYIDMHFCRRKDDDFVEVTVYSLKKLLVYTLKIPAIEIIQHNNLPWISSEIKATSSSKTKTNVDREQLFIKRTVIDFIYKPRQFVRVLRTSRNFFRLYQHYSKRLTHEMHCERLDITAVFGFEDAAFTGIIQGILASMIAIMLKSMHNRVAMDSNPVIKLMPVYGNSHFEVEVRCIFRIRLGNVISAAMARLTKSLHREATRSG